MRWTGRPLSSPDISYHLCNADQYSDDDVNGGDDDDGDDDDNNGGHFSLKIRHLCSLLADADWCSDDDFGGCDDDVDQDECEEKDFDGDDDDYNYGHCLLQIHHFCNLLVAAGESTCAHMSASLNKISRPKNVKI